MSLWEEFTYRRRAIREEYARLLEARYAQADADCNGVLLNHRGRRAGIDPESLFMGPFSRVEAYASEELYEWFERNGRTTYTEFEAAWIAGEGDQADGYWDE